ncbi:MAG: replication factor C large subunit [ANME-2 cluster archaeon]|nr:replication factor C large subunit [ANME-2 cluster archaeon]
MPAIVIGLMNAKPLEWAEKYRPRVLTELAGHPNIVKELLGWGQGWEKGIPKDRALILYGKPGIGKTSAAFALANQMEWDVIELNASDQRTASIIQKVAGSASMMGTFDGTSGRRLVILDEADNLHGNYDRGGARAIINVVKNTKQPLILIANEFYDMDSALRLVCKPVQFRVMNSTTMVNVLKSICRQEGVMAGVGVIEQIADNAGGDLRSAINDLQAIAIGKHELDVDDIVTAPRDTRETVFRAMDKIFKASDMRSAQEAAWHVDESPDNLINWIDENLPVGYTDERDMSAGFCQLSRADQFLGRVRIRQNYRLWRYASLFMTGGVAAVKTRNYTGYNKYQAPQFWKKLGQTRAKRNIRDSLAGKIGGICHVSKRYARSDLIWFFKHMMNSKEHAVDVAAELEMNPDEIAFLLDTKASTKKVKTIYESAQQLIQARVEHDIEVFGGFKHTAPVDEHQLELDLIEADNNGDADEPLEDNIASKGDTKNQSSLFDF